MKFGAASIIPKGSENKTMLANSRLAQRCVQFAFDASAFARSVSSKCIWGRVKGVDDLSLKIIRLNF